MKKGALWVIIYSFCILISRLAFAGQGDAPRFIIINSKQVPITFDAINTTKADIPPESANNPLVIEPLPAKTERFSFPPVRMQHY